MINFITQHYKHTKNKKGKVLAYFHPISILSVPKGKENEYNKFGYWTELVKPDTNGNFKNLNGDYFVLDTTMQYSPHYKENLPMLVIKE